MPGGPYAFSGRGVTTPTGSTTAPVWTTGATLNGVENHPVLFVASAPAAPTATLTVIAGSLPSGLSFTDYGNGAALIAGTPTAPSTGSITMRATNVAGTADQVLSVVISADTAIPPASNIYTVPASIDNTGATDVTAALRAFIATVPNGTPGNWNVIRFRAGTYKCETILELVSRHDLVLDGSLGTRLLRVTNSAGVTGPNGQNELTADQLRLRYCDRMVVYGLEIQGANPFPGYTVSSSYDAKKETQHAIRLMGSTQVEVSNCTMHHTYGDAVYLGYGQIVSNTPRICDGIWIHDNVIHSTGRQGISPCGVNHYVIENNVLHDMRRAAIDIEPIGFPTGSNPAQFAAYDGHLLTNQIDDVNLSTFANKGSGLCDTLVIKGNFGNADLTCYFGSSNFNDGTPGETRYNLWFHDNVFTTRQMAWPIPIQRWVGASFRNNTVAVQNRQWTSIDGVYHPIVANHVPPWTTDTRVSSPFVESNYCQQIASAGNTISPSTGAQKYDNNPIAGGSPISTTPPSPPDVAGRSGGGWTP